MTNIDKNISKIVALIGTSFLITSARMIYEGSLGKIPSNSPTEKQFPSIKITASIIGSIISFLTGIIGLGGGYALIPSFIYFLRAQLN